jgi:hypothetical protein
MSRAQSLNQGFLKENKKNVFLIKLLKFKLQSIIWSPQNSFCPTVLMP